MSLILSVAYVHESYFKKENINVRELNGIERVVYAHESYLRKKI